jgi:hypothetical protein
MGGMKKRRRYVCDVVRDLTLKRRADLSRETAQEQAACEFVSVSRRGWGVSRDRCKIIM